MAQLWYSPLNINAAQVPTTQSNFPVLVSVTDARLKDVAHGGHVNRSDGFDIRPYTDTTLVTALSYELERYIPSTGELIMWVKVASLTSSSTPIVLGYGDTGITTDGSSGTNTFSNSFDAVYHLKDGTTLSLVDALGSHNGTNHSATATSGKIDGAASLASASSQYIDCGAFADSSACTLSAWVNATSFPNTYNGIGGWNATATTRQAMIWVKSTGKMTFFVQAASGSVGYDGTGSNTLSSATDYYIVMTYSSAAGLVGYVNASSDGTAAANGVLASHTAVASYIGQDPVTAGRFWNGKIDEFRVATVARSADWITTEYNNQSAPGTFETLGAEVQIAPLQGLFGFTPVVFAPTDIAGCKLWLKASSLSLNDGDPISTWTDSSGSGNDMTGTTTTRPLYKTNIINSLPAALFDGTDDFMSHTGQLEGAQVDSVFAVIQPTLNTASQKNYACLLHDGGFSFLVVKITTSFWGTFTSPGGDLSSANALTAGSNYLLECTTAGTGTVVYLYQKGAQVATRAAAGISGPGGTNVGLGKDLINANRQYAGYISEIISYDRVLSDANRILVENYLISRYAL